MPEKTELIVSAGEKIVTPEAAFKKAQRVFVNQPSGANYNAMLIAARAYQNAYITAFQAEIAGSK